MFCLFLALSMHHVSWTHMHIANIGYKILLTNSKDKKIISEQEKKNRNHLFCFPGEGRRGFLAGPRAATIRPSSWIDSPCEPSNHNPQFFASTCLTLVHRPDGGRRPAAGGWGASAEDARIRARAPSAARRRSYQRSEGGLGVVVACSSSRRR
jgi:hypothetical protein